MIAYFTDYTKRVVRMSTNLNREYNGCVKHILNKKLDNPGEYYWNGSSLSKLQPVPFSLSKHLISIGEETILATPIVCTMLLSGPSLQQTVNTDVIEFSSDRRGMFSIVIKSPGYCDTLATIEVI